MSVRRKIISLKKEELPDFNAIEKIDQIFYINLEHRKDRKESILKEIKKIDPNLEKTTRIDAIKREKGAIGCGLSHIKALELAIKKDYKNILILEDDFIFTTTTENINFNFNNLFYNFKNFNICLLAGNMYRTRGLTDNIRECIEVQTTSAYIISKKFYQTLLDNFKNAVEKLESRYVIRESAIDVTWKRLQGRDKKFYIFYPKLGKQASSYSDIEKRNTNYNC